MQLPERFRQFIAQHLLFSQEDHLLLAVSGGLDSVVLAYLCRYGGYRFSIAHCNFSLRGIESDGDAEAVRGLAAALGVPYYEKGFDTKRYSEERKVSIQVAARELRYAWFAELRENTGARVLLTAHHADDAVETVLMNFFKGTGIAGLHGIQAKNGPIRRPLLFATRAELEAFARAEGFSWREDSSNSDKKYTRNAVRHELLPAIEAVFPGARANLMANIPRFAEVEAIYRASVEIQVGKLLEWNGPEARVPVRKLLRATPLDTLLWEMARPFGFTAAQVPGLRALLQSGPGRYMTAPGHQAVRHGAWLLFAPLQYEAPSIQLIQKDASSAHFNGRILEISPPGTVPTAIPAEADVALIDAAKLDYPLILRPWKAGDYFYPLGMRKKKKLARFFIDSKLSKVRKESVWVLESHKRIVWVIGLRIDDRFKITAATARSVRFRVIDLPNVSPDR